MAPCNNYVGNDTLSTINVLSLSPVLCCTVLYCAVLCTLAGMRGSNVISRTIFCGSLVAGLQKASPVTSHHTHTCKYCAETRGTVGRGDKVEDVKMLRMHTICVDLEMKSCVAQFPV